MKLVYVAGSFRGKTPWDVAQNVRRAEVAGLEVAKAGAMPVIPHANTANFDGQLTGKFWLDGTMEILKRCDAIYVFDRRDLTSSSGTRAEHDYAKSVDMPIFFHLDRLAEWIAQ